MIYNIAIILFILMETGNVCILYFWPESRYGNGVAVFNYFHESKENHDHHLFVSYMTNWVANVKLIFIVLLLMILLIGTELMKQMTMIVMILSIMAYYWRLHPIIKELDERGQITPKGYSKVLFGMITGMIIMFSVALLVGMF
ncbi:hypothetical protein [Tannockella kyphosi]|uniref:hypothetical protein n=1 Tax=Tannockella kyphosi TaxID=2899121 RepID=UPI0020124313|nr:hypothetical protein [Tannockella kyphosi]